MPSNFTLVYVDHWYQPFRQALNSLMTKLGMKCQQNVMWFEFMLDWLQLRTRKLFVFTSIFSFCFLVDLLYEQSSLQDNNVGSFLYVVLWNTFIFHINNFPLTQLVDVNAPLALQWVCCCQRIGSGVIGEKWQVWK